MQLAQTLSTQASVFAEPIVMICFKNEKKKRHNAAEDALGLRLQMRKQGPPLPLAFLRARSCVAGAVGRFWRGRRWAILLCFCLSLRMCLME